MSIQNGLQETDKSRHRARLWYHSLIIHSHPTAQQSYLELVALPADAACESRLLNQLFHLLQECSLGHHLTLFVCLEKNTGSMSYSLSP